jgi:hypothetical protein
VVAAMAEASKAAHGATMRNVQLPVDVFTSENV